METIIHTKHKFTENMLQTTVRDILSFWTIELKQTINIMDSQYISKKIQNKIKKKFKSCFQYLEKKNILHYIDINVDTYYAIIILFTLYARCMYKDSKRHYINDKKMYMYMEIGLEKHSIQLDALCTTINNTYAILLPFQIVENILYQLQGKEIIHNYLIKENNIEYKQILRKILHYQKTRIYLLETFNRFPIRNRILNREPTINEIDYVDEQESLQLK